MFAHREQDGLLHLIQLTSTIVLVPMLLHAWMCVWLAPVSCKCASYKTLFLFQAKMALLMEPLLPHKHCRLRACLTTSALSVSASAARPSAAASSACASVRTWCTYATRSHSRAWRGTSSIEGVLAFTPASSVTTCPMLLHAWHLQQSYPVCRLPISGKAGSVPSAARA